MSEGQGAGSVGIAFRNGLVGMMQCEGALHPTACCLAAVTQD